MEAGVAAVTERARDGEGVEGRFQTAGAEVVELAMERERRAAQAASEAGPVMTRAAAEQLAESRREVPAEAAYNGMGA